MEILSSRTILRPSEYERTLSFYRDTLGLAVAREYPGGTVFFAGQGLIEVAAHGGTGEGGFRGAIDPSAVGARHLRRAGSQCFGAELAFGRGRYFRRRGTENPHLHSGVGDRSRSMPTRRASSRAGHPTKHTGSPMLPPTSPSRVFGCCTTARK